MNRNQATQTMEGFPSSQANSNAQQLPRAFVLKLLLDSVKGLKNTTRSKSKPNGPKALQYKKNTTQQKLETTAEHKRVSMVSWSSLCNEHQWQRKFKRSWNLLWETKFSKQLRFEHLHLLARAARRATASFKGVLFSPEEDFCLLGGSGSSGSALTLSPLKSLTVELNGIDPDLLDTDRG